MTRDSPSGPFGCIRGPGWFSTGGRGWGPCVMGLPVPPVLAVDVFDKLNFTGARVPRLEHLRGEVPRDLESSVYFSEDFFKPAEKRGKADETRGLPRGLAGGDETWGLPWGLAGGGGQGRLSLPWPPPSALHPAAGRLPAQRERQPRGCLTETGWFITWWCSEHPHCV